MLARVSAVPVLPPVRTQHGISLKRESKPHIYAHGAVHNVSTPGRSTQSARILTRATRTPRRWPSSWPGGAWARRSEASPTFLAIAGSPRAVREGSIGSRDPHRVFWSRNAKPAPRCSPRSRRSAPPWVPSFLGDVTGYVSGGPWTLGFRPTRARKRVHSDITPIGPHATCPRFQTPARPRTTRRLRRLRASPLRPRWRESPTPRSSRSSPSPPSAS